MARTRIGIDVGGTFTDLVELDLDTGALRTEKTLTTPGSLWDGIWKGLQELDSDLERAQIAHGTTVGLNTFLERRGAATGLITTAGFRDVYEIGRGARPDMYNLFYRKPVPLVSRQHRLEVRERLDSQGEIVTALDETDVQAAIAHFGEHGIQDIAVCFLHSYRNPVHELRVAELLGEGLPDARVSMSHALVREWREYERTSTVVINSYIRPPTEAYLQRAMQALREAGYREELFVNQSSGGVVSARTAVSKPVLTMMSGPAGGVAASARMGELIGHRNVIAFDMGGTSTDVSVIVDGRPRLTADSEIDGHPISVPTLDIHSIGAGGGSVAWLDEVGALHVGPRSAGAEPGPVCYGRGGTEPTVTDANLVLGRLSPPEYVPGGLSLDVEAAEQAIRRTIAEPLGLAVEQAAAGIIDIVNLKMSMAVRAVTVQKGLDPRDFALIAFGGAGGAHACWVAAELAIPTIIVPAAAGQFSALGVALTDVRHDFVRTHVTTADELTPQTLAARFAAIEDEAREALAREQVPTERMELSRSVDVRYRGQEYTIGVPVRAGKIDADALSEVAREFHQRHELTYGHASPEEPIEVVNLRVGALGRLPARTLTAAESSDAEPAPQARFGPGSATLEAGAGRVAVDIWRRPELRPGNTVAGPAIVADRGATTVLPAGFSATVGRYDELRIEAPRRP